MFIFNVASALWASLRSLFGCSPAQVDEEHAAGATLEVVVQGGNLARVQRAHLRAQRAGYLPPRAASFEPPRPPFFRYGAARLPSYPPPAAGPIRPAVPTILAGGRHPTVRIPKPACMPLAVVHPPTLVPAPTANAAVESFAGFVSSASVSAPSIDGKVSGVVSSGGELEYSGLLVVVTSNAQCLLRRRRRSRPRATAPFGVSPPSAQSARVSTCLILLGFVSSDP